MQRPCVWALSALLVATAGCYHATIDTGFPAATHILDIPWASGYFWGLVPPDVVTSAVRCPSGVSKVETSHSVLNSLVTAVTLGIYTPMHLRITCAA